MEHKQLIERLRNVRVRCMEIGARRDTAEGIESIIEDLENEADVPADGLSPRALFTINECPKSQISWSGENNAWLFLHAIPPLSPAQARQLHAIIGVYLKGRPGDYYDEPKT